MTRTVCLPIAVAVLACIPLATIAQPLDTPGVTSPLTAAQIARENPPNVLTGAAVDKPVVLKSAGGVSVRVVKLAEGLSHPDGLVFLPDVSKVFVTTAWPLVGSMPMSCGAPPRPGIELTWADP